MAAAECRSTGEREPAASAGAGRLPGLDALKGIAIIGVVAIHIPPSDAPFYRSYVLDGVARLAVPLFLMISGFLLGSRPPSRTRATSNFWKFLRLHLIYGAFYWLVDPLRGVPHAPITLKVAAMHFAAFSFPGQFYLFGLTQIYFALGYLLPPRLWGSTALLFGSLLLAVATVASSVWSLDGPDPDSLLGRFARQGEASATLWLFPFSLGMWVGRRSAHSLPSGGASCLALVLLAVLLVTFDLPVTGGPDHIGDFAYARWSVGIASILLAFALPYAARALQLAPLASLGRESFGIFVLNPLITGFLVYRVVSVTTVTESLVFVAITLAIALPLTRFMRTRVPIAFP